MQFYTFFPFCAVQIVKYFRLQLSLPLKIENPTALLAHPPPAPSQPDPSASE